MASGVTSISTWKQANPDWMERKRADRPCEFRLRWLSGDAALDERRYAVLDELWTWPRAFRNLGFCVNDELSPRDEEDERDLHQAGRGLSVIEAARARSGEWTEARFHAGIDAYLRRIRTSAATIRQAVRDGQSRSVVDRRRNEKFWLKREILLWMFRFGVRKLDPAARVEARVHAIEELIRIQDRLRVCAVRDAERLERRLRAGVYRIGANTGRPYSAVRRYAIERELDRARQRAESLQEEIGAARTSVAEIHATGRRLEERA